jgi:hypothetical protein
VALAHDQIRRAESTGIDGADTTKIPTPTAQS